MSNGTLDLNLTSTVDPSLSSSSVSITTSTSTSIINSTNTPAGLAPGSGVSVNNDSSLSSFEKFCGNSPFWDTDLLLDSSFPRLTPCFQQVAVAWIPCLIYIVACAPYLYYVFAKASVPVPRIGFIGTAKTIGISCLLLITAVNIIVRAGDDQDGVPGALYVSEVLKLVAFILAIIISSAERSKGIVASPLLWTFWFFLFILNIIPFYSYLEGDKQHMDRCDFILFAFYFFLVLLSLLIASLVEKREEVQDASTEDKNECPMSQASIPNRLMFFWMNRLVILGYKRTLVEDDIFELNTGEKLGRIAPRFQETWLKQKRKVDAYNATVIPPPVSRITTRSSVRDEDANRDIPLLPVVGVAGDSADKSPYKKMSVFKVLFANHGPQLISALLVKAASDCFTLLTPKITEALLAYVGDRDRYYEWYGYCLAVSYLVIGTITSVISNQTTLYAKRCGIRMKVALINAVYRKSLTAANIGDESSKGEINNLMSVSTQKIEEISQYIHLIFSAPLQVIIALYLLYEQLGPAVFAGLSVMLLTVPLNGLVGFFFERWQIEMMARKDERGSLLSQILNGIKVLKLYAWEISFQKKTEYIRSQELKVILYMQYVMAGVSFIYQALPSLVQITAFGVYISTAGYLDPTVCFVSLQLFAMLNSPLMTLPLLIPAMIQTMVALTLISNYLNKSDIKKDAMKRDSNAANAVEIRNGSFTWTLDNPVPTLRNINMEVLPGSLVAVVGTVGCGKSSLMSAVLGEMEKLSGDVKLKGTIAYVPQEAWIQNATLRDNITFGKEHNAGDYDRVVEACALKSDLAILPGGDMTEIGEKGINISGGQKQRVSLARAVYSDREIFLLDDPLSAVDSHVGKHIFDKVIGKDGVLSNKTRVLVTHGIHWLPMVDKIFVLTQGEISETGTYSELLEKDGDFAQFIKEYAQEEKNEDTDEEEEVSSDKKERERKESTRSDGSVTSKTKAAEELEEANAGAKLTDEESGLSGRVKASTYFYFLKQIGFKSFCLSMILFLIQAGCNIFSAIWLTIWTGDEYLLNRTNKDDSGYNDVTHRYLAIYACASIVSGLFVFVFFMIAAVKLTGASRIIHNNMLANVLRSPMLFFDTTPIGRILNRFTMDVDIMDMSIPMSLNQLLNVSSMVLVTIVNICYGTPIFLVALIPLTILYICVQALYIPTCRQLRRIESITRSPIYVQFSETLNGTDSIRAYECQERFIEESVRRVDHNLKFYFASVSARCWLTLWLNFLGNMVIFLAAIFAVAATNIEPSVVGLSVAYASTMTRALEDLVNGTSDTETNLVSIERMKEYTVVEQEAPWSLEDKKPKPEWPQNGEIVFDNYQTRYRPGLDLVLKDVSCTIKGGEKIGIVGRTGAGKSSMTVALFRIIEAAGGKIVIDGEDVSKMGLHDLRSKITILPQDPVIFSGSMRLNLDPFELYTEQNLWNALEHSYLKEFVEGLPEKLEYECGEEGSNLSVGQRQLVCLARTLLRKTKILVLDEATAAVDMETDDLIQKTIRKEFKDSTILTIAHRLNTIMDYDRVMVLDKGCIKEFDSPAVLLADDTTIFHGMAKEAGLV